MRVVGDLPRVTLRVEEHGRVAAPERLRRLAADRGARPAGLVDDRVDLPRRAHVVRERDAAPAAPVLDRAVLRQERAIPERDDDAVRLEEDDVVVGPGASLPPERLVERARVLQVAHPEGDQAEPLLHRQNDLTRRGVVPSAPPLTVLEWRTRL